MRINTIKSYPILCETGVWADSVTGMPLVFDETAGIYKPHPSK